MKNDLISFSDLMVCSLAGWRTAFFVTDDFLSENPKSWITARFKSETVRGYLAVFFTCIYCVTFWTSGGIVGLSLFTPLLIVINGFAIWGGASLIGKIHDLIVSYIKVDEEEAEEEETDE